MSSLSIAKSRNPKSVTPKKGSAKSNATTRRKVIPSTAANAKKLPRSVESKAERVAAAKTPVKLTNHRSSSSPSRSACSHC